ncbi:MAG: hypothetical protein JNJ61_06500 [Anaerolineae bacterium]|nr:hypothetical protein [Anaerolineae bacterium]
MMRYWRAFWGALRLTLRGEPPPAPKQPAIVVWTRELERRMDAVLRAAERDGLDENTRRALKLRLDGRQMSLETALQSIRFHAAQEYPSLLHNSIGARSLNAIYASNMNDRYWLNTLLSHERLQTPTVQAALSRVAEHMDAVPSLEQAWAM